MSLSAEATTLEGTTQTKAPDQSAPRETLRVLAVGTDYTEDAIVQDLYDVALADGQPMVIGCLVGGDIKSNYEMARSGLHGFRYVKVSSEGHSETLAATLATALKDEKWDIIVLDQDPEAAVDAASYEPYLTKLLKYLPKGVKVMWHQNWAFENADRHDNFLADHFGTESIRMYDALMLAEEPICERHHMEVIPTGTTLQNLRSGFTMENTVSDGAHLSTTLGRYAAACTWYEALTGRETIGSSYAPQTLQNWVRRDAAQRAAHAAIASPWAVTSQLSGQSQYHSAENGHYLADESEVPEYTVPDPLVMNDGTPVTTTEQWMNERRPELLELFRTEVYGHSAPRQPGQHFKVLRVDPNALGGLATCKEVAIYYTADEEGLYMDLLLWTPNAVDGPAPCIVKMNHFGNIGFYNDPAILMPTEEQLQAYGCFGYPWRGMQSHLYPLAMILSRGYGVATFYKGDIDPDRDDGFQNGVQPYIYRPGQTYPDPDQWGTISAWAWGYSRVMDYLETDSDVDEQSVAAMGFSRSGKTALWAVAQDPRFALAISNDSGCTGAALSRRRMGQTLRAMQCTFPSWCCTNYLKYMDNEDALPVDQHELIALIAPRPVYVGSASLDSGADPRGEFESVRLAQRVYQLFGYKGLDSQEFPAPQSKIDGDHMAYHLREGKHSLTAWDWANYLDFCDKYLKK